MKQTFNISITLTPYSKRQLEFLKTELQENRSKIITRAIDMLYEKIKTEVTNAQK